MERKTSKLTFETYTFYKDAGTEWLGEIPENWKATRMKFLFHDVSIKNKPDEELLSVTQNKGVVPRSWVENRMVMPSGNLESFKFIEKGDFAISLRSFEGGLEYCHHNGIISPAYTVLKKKNGLFDGYYKYLFKSSSFISEIQTSVVGIREGKNISYPELSTSLLPIPSKEEQIAIANFLDEKTIKIDQAIAQKERMIELLKERKQIIIQNAVTKGLDSNVKLKDSGIAWIGEIPEHWEIFKFKQLFHEKKKKLNGQLPAGAISYGFVRYKPENSILESTKETYQEVLSGEFLINPLNLNYDLVSLRIALSEIDVVVSSGYIVLNQSRSFDKNYMKWLLHRFDISQMKLLGSGVRQTINFGHLSNELLILPPKKEQELIQSWIGEKLAKIDSSIALQQKQIKKLKEYKATLIDSAVTGKIKVC
ncbi:restriction endonuclease subunit S [Winogradskyella poriferorum]|uniref:restriction endonuclease subunit S n=1 Tax=Winogradskyella poriferorum TaxID=307627 RepID=UPI003D6533B7